MANRMGLINAAAGVGTGSPYLAVLSYLAKAVASYVINETNFAGVGKYLPGFVTIASGTAANVRVQISTDNGTTWKDTAAASGGLFFCDAGGQTGGVSTSATIRITISTGATDIFLFPLGLY